MNSTPDILLRAGRWTLALLIALAAFAFVAPPAAMAQAQDPPADKQDDADEDTGEDEDSQASDDADRKAAAEAAGTDDSKQPSTRPATTQRATTQPADVGGHQRGSNRLEEARRRALRSVSRPSANDPQRRAEEPARITRPSRDQDSAARDRSRTPANRTNVRQPRGANGDTDDPAAGDPAAVQPRESRRSRTNARTPADRRPPTPAVRPPASTTGATDAAAQPGDADTSDPSAPVTNTTTTMRVIEFDLANPDPESREYTFSYHETPWPEVLRDFSRMSGLPLANLSSFTSTDTLTYYSAEKFTFLEAYHKLNELLLAVPYNNYVLQRHPTYLTIDPIPELANRIPVERMFNTFEEFEAANLDPYDVCMTVYRVPEGWTPYEIIELFRTHFSDTYGTEIIGDNEIELEGLAREHHEFKRVVAHLTSLPRNLDLRDPVYTKFQLKHAKAQDVYNMLRQLYPAQGGSPIVPTPPRGRGRQPAATPSPVPAVEGNVDQLAMVADTRNNIIYADGPDYLMNDVAATIANLDVGEFEPPQQEVVPVRNASANAVINAIRPVQQLMQASLVKGQNDWIAPEVRAALNWDISPAFGENAILVVGGSEGLAQARKLIQQFDVAPDWRTRVIELAHADANQLTPIISGGLPPVAPGDQQAVLTPYTSKSILVTSTQADFDKIMEMVAAFDKPADQRHEHFVSLQHAKPSDVAETITQLIDSGAVPAIAPRQTMNVAAVPQPAQAQQQQQAGRRGRQPRNVRVPTPAVKPGQPQQMGETTIDQPVLLPDDAAGTLIVFCVDRDWPRIEGLIDDLDEAAGRVKPVMETIALEHADAQDVAQMINQMLTPVQGLPTKDDYTQMVTADAYNNTITLWAKPDFIEEIRPLIAKLDVPMEGDVKVIRLRNCKAEVIQPILAQAILGADAPPPPISAAQQAAQQAAAARNRGRGARQPAAAAGVTAAVRGNADVRIVAEPITNSLIVQAPPKQLKQIEDLVAQMEAKTPGPSRVVLEAMKRPAQEIADTLVSMMASGVATAGSNVPGLHAGGQALKVVAIGDRIILDGPQDQVAEAIQLVDNIDVEDQAPVTRKFKVVDAELVERLLREQLTGIQQAGRAASTRQAPGRAVANRPGQPQQPVQQINIAPVADQPIQISTNTDDDTIMVTAKPSEFPRIEKMLAIIMADPEQVENGPKPGDTPLNIHFIALKHKKAFDIAFTVEDLFNDGTGSKIRLDESPTDERTLMVTGYRPAQIPQIEELVSKFDTPGSGGSGKIYRVDLEGKMPAEQILQIIARGGYSSKSGIPVKVGGRMGSDLVQVIDIHADEEEEPATDGQAPAGNSTPSGATPSGISPCVLPATLLNGLAVSIGQSRPQEEQADDEEPRIKTTIIRPSGAVERREPTGGELTDFGLGAKDELRIFTDPGGNLVIVGPEDEAELLEEFIEELLPEEGRQVIRVFPLKYADVNAVTQLLNEVFNQSAPSGAAARRAGRQPMQMPQAMQPQQPQIDPKTGQPVPQQQGGRQQQQQQQAMAAPVQARIKVVPDERTKSLFVVAAESDIPQIVDVLKKIDVSQVDHKTLRIFKLEKLEAEQVVQNLRDILGLDQPAGAAAARGRGRPGQQQPQGGQNVEQQIVGMPGTQGAATVSADKIKLTAEPQTNIIIAQAPPDTLELIAGLIAELETLTNTRAWEMRRVALKHARATEIAEIVDDLARELLVGGGAGGQQQPQQFQGGPGGGRGGPRRGGANRVLVESDARTNSVIIAGEKKDLDVCVGIINDLDIAGGDTNVRQFAVKGTPTEMVTTLKELFNPSRGGRGPDTSDIVITANDATRLIIVKAPTAQMAEIEDQIKKMDAEIEDWKALRTIVLKVANAESVAETLNTVFGEARGRTGRGGAAGGEVSIHGNKSTSTLFVRCPDELFDQIKQVANDLDKAPTDVSVTRFSLKHAAAQAVHSTLQTMMVQAVSQRSDLNLDLIGITPDPRTNSLVLVGGPTSKMLMTQMLAQVDVPPETPLQRKSKSYTLPTGQDVNQVAQNINAMFQGVSPHTHGVEAPRVTANVAASMIIVDANDDQHKKIEDAIINPILANVGEGPQSYQVKLQFARADEIKPIIEDSMSKWKQARGNKPQDSFTVTADPNSNLLLVNAAPHVKAEFDKQLAQLDTEGIAISERNPMAYVVKYASPQAVQQAIAASFPARAGMSSRDQVSVSVDMNTNTVLVNANEKNQQKVAELVAMMDVEGEAGAAKKNHAYQVKHAQATQLATLLTNHFNKVKPAVGRGFPVNIVGDDAASMLIVNANDKDYDEVLAAIQQFDVPPPAEMQRKTFKLTYADPGAVAQNINRSFAPTGRMPSPRDVVLAVENWTTNTVFVTANAEKMKQIEGVIGEMDRSDGGERKVHTINVVNANPVDVANAVQQIYADIFRMRRQQTPPSIKAVPGTTQIVVHANDAELAQITDLVQKADVGGGRVVHTVIMPEQVPARTVSDTINQLFGAQAGRTDGPKAQYHEPTNTVLVHATDVEFDKINKQLIEPLGKSEAAFARQFYKIKLKYAVADEVAQTLQEFFDKKSGASTRRNLPPWMRGGQQQQDDNVAIIAEPTSNTLLVFATEAAKKLIDDLIADIDSDDGPERIVQMVTLEHTDATEMIDILTEYLKVPKRSDSGERDEFVPWWFDGRREQQDEKVVLAGDMRLKAIESSNSIILAGRQESVNDAIAKIKELDVPNAGVMPEVVKLENSNATEVAEALTQLFIDSRTTSGRDASGVKLTIVPRDASNELIIRGKPSEVSAVVSMATDMDRRMAAESYKGGIQLVKIPLGQNVEDLADRIESIINDGERDLAQKTKGYKEDRVQIAADQRASVLMVHASRSKLEEVVRLVDELVSLTPDGGAIKRTVIKLDTLSAEDARRLAEQLQEGSNGSGSNRGNRGGRGFGGARRPRGDAGWTHDRRYDRLLHDAPCPAGATNVAGSVPAFLMNATAGAAISQTTQPARRQPERRQPEARQPERRQPERPRVNTIRPRQPADRTGAAQPGRPGASATQPAARTTQPTTQMTPEELIREAAARSGGQMNDLTREQLERLSQQLSGAPLTIVEAGPDGIIVEGLESDVEIFSDILQLLDQATPQKEIRYVKLKNAQARNLAETLNDVFGRIEPARQLPQDKVDIIADSRTNGLYIAATPAKIPQVLELIAEADREPPDDDTRRFVFKNRRVTEAAEVLKSIAAEHLRQKGLQPDQITLQMDQFTNSVYVTANEADMKFMEETIKTLDMELPEEVEEEVMGQANVMIVPLKIAKADTLATLLMDLLTKAATGDTPMKDFIRRLRLLDEQGQPLATVDLNKPIFVFGDPDSNALMIASTLENCLIMKQVALAFDKEPSKAAVEHRVFALRYADAQDVTTTISEMLTASEDLTLRPGKPDRGGVPEGEAGTLVYKAVIKADPRTNQVVVVGRPDAVAILSNIITQLDVKGADVMPFEIVPLEYASATGLAQALNEMMEARKAAIPTGTGENAQKAETVIITPDARSQTLIIAARRERAEELKELIRKLDVKATALVENIRTITLKNTSATDLAQKLQELWTQQAEQRGGEAGGFAIETPAIVADQRSNSLIVAASPSDFEAIEAIVQKIENLPLNPMADIYIVRLQNNSASQLVSPLQSLFDQRAAMRVLEGEPRPEDKVTIQADEVTNSLLITASRENYDVLRQKVDELDVPIAVTGQIEFFECENVSALRIKDVIDQMFEEPPFKPGATGGGEIAETRERVNVVVDDRSNTMIVSASPENMALVRNIHGRMNSVKTPWDSAITRIIDLKFADAVEVAAQVEDYFQRLDEIRQTGGEGGAASTSLWGVKLFHDERRNRLIVGGTKDGIDRAVELIKQLDVPPGTPNQEVQVYPLVEAPAVRVGEMIQAIFQERNQARQGATGPQINPIPVTVQVQESTNSIAVNATKLDHILVRELIAKLDRPSALLQMTRVFNLRQANAERIKEILDEIYQAGGGQGGTGGTTVSVVPDLRSNSVVVAAPPGELANVGQLIEQLDKANIDALDEVEVYPINNEDASKMAELINQIMTGEGGGEGAIQATADENLPPPGSRGLRYSREGQVLRSLRENISISYNERSNSVIVVAPPAAQELIAALIAKLDGIQKREVMVKVFLLRNADATAMVEKLEAIFAQEAGAEDQQAFQEGREFQVEGGSTTIGDVPTAASQNGDSRSGTFGRPKTTFVPDERTNSVIVAGWGSDIEVVSDIIDQLDSRDIQPRDALVYTVVNMEAEDMQTALDAYFQAEKSVFEGIEALSPQQKLEREVTVTAHPESNQLVVSSSPRLMPEVMRIIEQLDAPPPQVRIEVMIAEVTLNDSFEMGLEFALQELRFSETAVAGPNGILQSSHFDVIGGTDLGAAGSGLGGFSFTVTGEDFNFLVRALQSDSRLEVIQRPMIMCQDNQIAKISVGQEVPTPTGTAAGADTGGTFQTQVQYQEVGIILEVEPNINPDGWVYMRVAPEVSAIADSTIQVAPGVFAPIFTNRSAETFVAVRDGETVVIGGLITTEESEGETKVPLLGDVPGLGALFRTTIRDKVKTELLLALTPRIVRTVEDGRRLSIDEIRNSTILTPDIKGSRFLGNIRQTPESVDAIDSIEDLPSDTNYVPVEPYPPGLDAEPVRTRPAPPPADQPRYGPPAPRYGPMVPSVDADDVVARRPAASPIQRTAGHP